MNLHHCISRPAINDSPSTVYEGFFPHTLIFRRRAARTYPAFQKTDPTPLGMALQTAFGVALSDYVLHNRPHTVQVPARGTVMANSEATRLYTSNLRSKFDSYRHARFPGQDHLFEQRPDGEAVVFELVPVV
jgi:hypothetical protein